MNPQSLFRKWIAVAVLVAALVAGQVAFAQSKPTVEVTAVVKAFDAKLVVDRPQFLYFPMPPEEVYTWIVREDGSKVNVACLLYVIRNTDQDLRAGAVTVMFITARGLAGHENDVGANRDISKRARAAFPPVE